MKDDFGDRMKSYEKALGHKITSQWACLRIDGRSFSKLTRKLYKEKLITRPRDPRFEKVFVEATKFTMDHFGFKAGFHQSDEVTIFFNPTDLSNERSEHPFGGKIQKLTSVVASFFTSSFVGFFMQEYGIVLAGISFDCRIIEFPTQAEAVNMLIWRFQDAKKNLISDIAHYHFGSKNLEGVNTEERYNLIGSPKLKPGNFMKRVSYEKVVDVKTSEKESVSELVTRHKIDAVDIDFDNMEFAQRVDFVYG